MAYRGTGLIKLKRNLNLSTLHNAGRVVLRNVVDTVLFREVCSNLCLAYC